MEIAFLFYEGMTALDAIGPHEVLCRLPGAKVFRVARVVGPVHTESAGLTLNAEYSLSDVARADVLVIPGGGNATTLSQYPEVHDWIRAIHATTQWTTSVCTGSLILGAAGILKGLPATTHWACMERLGKWEAVPTQARVVETGKVITAAGVSAGIDMALALADKIAGPMVAQALQLGIEYDPEPPFDVGSPEKSNPAIVAALRSRLEILFENV